MTTKFGSIDEVRVYISAFANVSRQKLRMRKITLEAEVRRKIRHDLIAPQVFIFSGPDGKEHTIVIDIYRDGFACWLVNEKGFARRL